MSPTSNTLKIITGSTYAIVAVSFGGYLNPSYHLRELENMDFTPKMNAIESIGTSAVGTLYCAGFPSGSIITDVNSIRNMGYYTVTTNANIATVTVTVKGLFGSKSYDFYCYQVDSRGSGTSLSQVLSTKTVSNTLCCRSVLFSLSSVAIGIDLVPVHYKLDTLPDVSLTVTPVFRVANGSITHVVKALPAHYDFTNISSLQGSFVVQGIPGVYGVSLILSGPDAAKYNVTYSITVTILSPSGLTSYSPPVPYLQSAQFGSSGSFALVLFSSSTNRASLGYSSWPCNSLFIFVGSTTCTCSWVDDQSVLVSFPTDNGSPMLEPGGTLTLKSGLLKAYCAIGNCNYASANISSINITAPATSTSPAVTLISPAVVSSCANLTLDASSSTGSGGRQWAQIKWYVSASDFSNTSSIVARLTTKSLTSPIIVPSRLLKSAVTYTFTLYVRNFLGKVMSGHAIVYMSPSSVLLPTVGILGPSVLTTTRSASFTLTASVSIPSCATSMTTASFSWRVYNDSSAAPWLGLQSTSVDPKSFAAPAYTLAKGHTYRFTVTVTLSGSIGYSSASTSVYVAPAPVVALISGGSNRVVVQGSPLLLDASQSIDGNIDPTQPQGLLFQWTCQINSGLLYLQSCSNLLRGAPSTAVVGVSTGNMTANVTYLFSVLVTSADKSSSNRQQVSVRCVVSSAKLSVSISSTATVTSTSSYLVNRNEKLNLQAIISSSSAVFSEWSIPPSSASSLPSLADAAITPSRTTFALSEVITPITYPITLAPYTLTEGHSYTFRITVSPVSMTGNVVSSGGIFSEVTVVVRSPPSSGVINVSPSGGLGLQTLFLLTTSGWTADVSDYPLSYQFFCDLYSPVQTTALGLEGSFTYMSTLLPTGSSTRGYTIYLSVVIAGSTGTASISSCTAVVTSVSLSLPSLQTNIQKAWQHASLTLDSNSVIGIVVSAASTLNAVNCITAPNCTALHRYPCSGTPNTCGNCYDGYYGVSGNSNFMCSPSPGSRRNLLEKQSSDAGCTVNADCMYGNCVKGSCTVGAKSCPTATASSVCSGHGNCTFVDIASGDFLPEGCASNNANCYAQCVCYSNYGGIDCSISTSLLTQRSKLRALLCDAVVNGSYIQDNSPSKLQSLASTLSLAFNPYEMVSAADLQSCVTALQIVVNLMSADSSLASSLNSVSIVAGIISSFVQFGQLSPFLYNLGIANLVSLAVDALHQSVLYDMAAGQQPFEIITFNFRSSVHYDLLSSLSNATLSAPATASEVASLLTLQHLVLPNSGLSSCGFRSKYATFAISQWGEDPYQQSAYITNILRFTTLNDSNSIASTIVSSSTKYVDLKLSWNRAVFWNDTMPDFKSIIGGMNFLSNCKILSYDARSATIRCPTSALCSSTPSKSRKLTTTALIKTTNIWEVALITTNPIILPTAFASEAVKIKVNYSTTAFYSSTIGLFLLGVLFFLFWDAREHKLFRGNRKSAGKFGIKRFAVLDAFSTMGINELSQISFAKTPPKDSAHKTFWETVYSPISFFDEGMAAARYVQAVLRHHSFLRIFTFPSLRLTRWLRFTCFCWDLLILLFTNTVFYSLAYPKNNRCNHNTTSSSCLAHEAFWVREKSLCLWDENRASCSIREPRGTFLELLIIALVVLAISIVPQIIVTNVIEEVFTRSINMHEEDRKHRFNDNVGNNNLATINGASTNISNNQKEILSIAARFDATMTSEEFNKDKKVRKNCQLIVSDVSLHHDCDEHLKNRALVQYFILEQLDFISNYLLSKHFFFTDSARPQRANRIMWLIVFISLLVLWVYFSYYIFYWTIFASVQQSFCWGVSFLISWFFKIIILEYLAIYLLYVLPVDLFHDRLFKIYAVLEGAFSATQAEFSVENRNDNLTPSLSDTSPGPITSAAYRASQRLSGAVPLRVSQALSKIDTEIFSSLRNEKKDQTKDSNGRSVVDRSLMPPPPPKPEIPKQLSRHVLPDSQRGHVSHVTLEEDEYYMLPRATVRVEHTFEM